MASRISRTRCPTSQEGIGDEFERLGSANREHCAMNTPQTPTSGSLHPICSARWLLIARILWAFATLAIPFLTAFPSWQALVSCIALIALATLADGRRHKHEMREMMDRLNA